jgi:HK97 gp10 family phage protein
LAYEALKIDGMRDVVKRLDNIGSKMGSSISRKGAARMAQVLRAEWKKHTPRGRTGRLAKSYVYRTKKLGRTGYAVKVGPNKDFAYIARFIEYGTSPHTIPLPTKSTGTFVPIVIKGHVRSTVQHPGTNAAPYLRPVFDRIHKKMLQAAATKMWAELNKEARKKR